MPSAPGTRDMPLSSPFFHSPTIAAPCRAAACSGCSQTQSNSFILAAPRCAPAPNHTQSPTCIPLILRFSRPSDSTGPHPCPSSVPPMCLPSAAPPPLPCTSPAALSALSSATPPPASPSIIKPKQPPAQQAAVAVSACCPVLPLLLVRCSTPLCSQPPAPPCLGPGKAPSTFLSASPLGGFHI